MRGHNPRFTPEALEANQAIAGAVRSVAERAEATAAQVAIAWVLAQGSHVVPIPGTRRIAYLEDNLAAAELELSAELLAELDALPEPVGPRY
jgi:aryl-alcohol dehydrogenase-like predicted oxidoreductase